MLNDHSKFLKKIFLLFLICCLCISCYKESPDQNFDVAVKGEVNDVNSGGIGNITIYIGRDKFGNFTGPSFSVYDSVVTDGAGNYSYLIREKDFSYAYQLCCPTSPGYSRLDNFCKAVDQQYVNGGTIPNTINFSSIH